MIIGVEICKCNRPNKAKQPSSCTSLLQSHIASFKVELSHIDFGIWCKLSHLLFLLFHSSPSNGLPFTPAGPLKLGQRFRYKSQQETKLALPNIAHAFNNRIVLENQNKTHSQKVMSTNWSHLCGCDVLLQLPWDSRRQHKLAFNLKWMVRAKSF